MVSITVIDTTSEEVFPLTSTTVYVIFFVPKSSQEKTYLFKDLLETLQLSVVPFSISFTEI